MNLLSPSNSSFYTDQITTDTFNGLIKSVKKIKIDIEYFKTVIVKNVFDLINENIVILMEDLIELDKKVLTLVPQIQSNQDKYSEHKFLRSVMYDRLGLLIKYGDTILIHCVQYEQQNADYEYCIYNYLIAAIEDYVNEVKKTVNISWEFQIVDCVDGPSPLYSEHHCDTTTESNYSNNPHLSWCEDEQDINLLKRRGFIRDSNTSRTIKTDSKESGFLSGGSYELDTELSLESPAVDLEIMELQSTWRQFVSSRSQDNNTPSSSRITFRPSHSLPSKGKEIVFGSSYTVEMTSTRLTIDDTEVVLRGRSSREKLFDDGNIDTLISEDHKSIPIQPCGANFMEYESVEQYLWMKNDENGRLVLGGTVDALIVYACNNKQKDYTDAFITTYKSFIGSRELVEKLIYRFEYFMKKQPGNAEYYRIAKKTFALLLIIVCELINLDLSVSFLEDLINCTYRIIRLSEIKLGRIFRQYVTIIILEFKKLTKLDKQIRITDVAPVANTINYTCILDIKPEILAQQICLLTHEIINNIRSSELLLYIDKQDIEIAPNFSALANHYNSISFWTATTILKGGETKTRRLMLHFIRVMQKLLEYGNYESCAALNSAFCSVSIYRIMPTRIMPDEFIELFSPMKNFKIYRERISCEKGACIPIIFLLIRDLMHIQTGNPNELYNLVNFAKRYQIYNTLAKFRNAKKSPYTFSKNLPVLSFLNNFRDYWNEEELIKKSYEMQPRGKVKFEY